MKKSSLLLMLLLLLATVFSFVSCGDEPTDPNEDPDDPTAHEHTYTEQVVNPTCTEKGYTTYTCECGETYKDKYTELTAHDLGEWETTVEATCTADGTKKRECKNCEYSEMAKIDKTAHSYTASVVAPTCVQQGYTLHTCKCGDSYKDTYVETGDHTLGDWYNIQNPCCTSGGFKMRECEHCDYSETEPVEALGHSYAPEVIPATCTSEGYTIYTCTVCADSYSGDFVEKADHSYTAWVNTVEPTCTVDGAKKRGCENCDYTETAVAEAPGHSYTEETFAPTCEDDGYTLYTCACGDSYKDNYVDATGHTFDKEVAEDEHIKSAANCKSKALYFYSCACGANGTETFEYGEISDHIKDSYGWCTICDEVLDKTPTSGLSYKISEDGTYAILVYTSEFVQKNVSKIIVADTYEGLPVTTIGQGGANGTPFQKCEKLTHVYLPDSVTTLASRAFDSCDKLTTVKLSANITSIGASAFERCTALETFVIPDKVTEILDYTFRYCSGLKQVDLGSGVQRILKEAFLDCTSLEGITIPDNITYLENHVFMGCTSLKTLDIGTGLTFIGSNAFHGCSSLESLVLPYNVGQINPSAFQDCTSLKTVVLTNNIRTLEDQVFWGCTALENVILGEDIWKIYPGAFTLCPNIKYNEKDGLQYLGSEEKPYLYLMGVVSKDITTATIDSTCVLINSYAFIGCTLENVFIPTATTEIMANAFSRCTLSTATFEKKSRWKYDMVYNITASDLSNESTAATYLTSTYSEEAWARYD